MNSDKNMRMVRGGAWYSDLVALRPAYRDWTTTNDDREIAIGFRLAMDVKTGDGGCRVVRGGSWEGAPGDLRSAYLYRTTEASRLIDLGFRLAMDLREKA